MIVIQTPIGYLGLSFDSEVLTEIHFLDKKKGSPSLLTPSIKKTVKKIESYFNKPFDLSSLGTSLRGTPFQKKVWRSLCQIPLGQTTTYGELAKKLKTSARAIGMACRSNPLPLVVPCHRVLSKQNLGGYCGTREGRLVDIKTWLLAYEQRFGYTAH